MDLNHWPPEYESVALPTELYRHKERFNHDRKGNRTSTPASAAGGLYGISGVTKPQLWLASKLSLTRPDRICTDIYIL